MAVPESGNIAVLAEKPSVARDIARVLGATSRGDGYLHGNGYVVTWAVGHLAALAQPHEINPEWRHWRRDLLGCGLPGGNRPASARLISACQPLRSPIGGLGKWDDAALLSEAFERTLPEAPENCLKTVLHFFCNST